MNLGTVKWAQCDKTQSRELHVCSYMYVSAVYYKYCTEQTIFPLTVQTITIAPMNDVYLREMDAL